MLPHSVDLRLNRKPYITYLVTILCVIVFYYQVDNRKTLDDDLVQYCESINKPYSDERRLELLATSPTQCKRILAYLHERKEHGAFEKIKPRLDEYFDRYISQEETEDILHHFNQHLDKFRETAPASFDGKLMHFPDELNPIPMITSSLAHGGFFHIFFNLIFFLAFAPAVEVIVGNKLKYLGILLLISLIICWAYAFSVFIMNDDPIPSLGLSGVVMGVIGMSGYLMPRARIKVLMGWGVFLKNIYIPAWMLAAWYIGWDTWNMMTLDDNGGVNLVSHVSGGIGGYLIGLFWLKNTKREIQDELDDEIEYMRQERIGSNTFTNYSGGRRELIDRQRTKQAKRDYDAYLAELYRYVQTDRDSDAVVLLLRDYDVYRGSYEIYDELFQRMKDWGESRTLLCLGRLLINVLLEKRFYARALMIAEQCQAVSEEFLLADPENVLLLASMARDQHQYQLAYLLVADAAERYGNYIDVAACGLLEAELLWMHLDQADKARMVVRNLLENNEAEHSPALFELARLIQQE